MEAKFKKAFQAFLKDPASSINTLNSLIPQLINMFPADSSQAMQCVSEMLQTLQDKRIIGLVDIEDLVLGTEHASDVKGKETR